MSRFSLIAALPLLAFAIPAAAQETEDPYAACAELAGDAERLACFDATYAAQRVILAEAAERAEVQREEVFGFRGEDRAAEMAQREEVSLTATVTEVLQGARRSQVLLFDNGQLWREIEGSTLRNRVREGWTGTVTRHWSGAYEIRFEGRSGYLRVTRVQ